MESLLRWSIQNSTSLDSAPSDRPPARREDLNPEIIDMILGKPDSELMKEDVAVAIDSSKSEDERIAALDHLEMLIEQIDNANNLEKLKLWDPLHSLLTSQVSTEIKVQALWVIGTAVQNNPAAQDAYLAFNPLPTLLSFLTPSPESTTQTRSKAIYTLSGLLKHNAPAVKILSSPGTNGWQKLKDALQDPNIAVRRKTIFLLGALLIPTSPVPQTHQQPLLLGNAPANPNATPSTSATVHEGPAVSVHTPDTRPAPSESSNEPIHDNSHAAYLRDASRSQTYTFALEAFEKNGMLDAVISSIVSPVAYGVDGENAEADHDYEEKALRVLHTYSVTCHGPLSTSQKETLKHWTDTQKTGSGGAQQLAERWNLTGTELAEFTAKL
ncbi:hypothetical protein EST38_g11708 [Candolleomyces aberdarensis]|uniref:Nucleotide exchange factor Fes1 domain-containing protein n=1 Tax=Candolleomyces aberdarensis TaxID=2316362 RepID=A0A4Q2D488_9AGAR|nr:hypothetical protein EST38_g11708 [Candolleomyces aberdarensis]